MTVLVRPLSPSDSLAELTVLLNRAYKELADQGWNYTASFQDEETTKYRVGEGVCFLALSEGKIVGTVMLVTQGFRNGPAEYRAEGACVLGQFGVDPDRRGEKIGDLLVSALEEEAARQGFRTLLLDTAETASKLIEYYQRRGFREVGHHQWRDKTYQSVVMAKPLVERKDHV